MESGSPQPVFQNNHDSYQEVFGILDEAGLAQLKPNFCDHCIQDKTLNYVESEEELKQLLKEIGIPLGMSIPIVKLWNRRTSKPDVPDVTKGTPNNKAPKVDQAVQVAVRQMDVCTQTEESPELLFSQYQGDPNYLQGLTAIAHYAEYSNFANNIAFVRPEAIVPGVNMPVTVQQSEVVASSSYLVPENQKIGYNPGTFPQFGNQYQMSHVHPTSNPAMLPLPVSGPNALSGVSPRPDSVGHEKKTVPAQNVAAAPGVKGEIVDEREDLAIQQSMDEFEEFQRELERKQTTSSYATAVKEHESHAREEAPTKENKPSISSSSNSSYQPHFPPLTSQHLSKALPPSRLTHASSHNASLPYTKLSTSQVSKQSKSNPNSSFAKCDDISVEQGVLRKSNRWTETITSPRAYGLTSLSEKDKITKSRREGKEAGTEFLFTDCRFRKMTFSEILSLQNVGSQYLHDYLDMIEESKEYREVIQRGNVKKGWKPLDGKHVASGRKVQFKPMHCDDKGRMCHGVRVRGADKSEECFKHTVGKAPAACSFAHSRLGDTLQFICVKCTCEKKRNEFCAEKQKHKQYHFNLGPYRNQNGDVWKQATPT